MSWKNIKIDKADRGKDGRFIKGHKVSNGWRGKKRPDMAELHSGDGNPMWKGGKIKKGGIHLWLRKTFGTRGACEHCNKDGALDWALVAGKEYKRERENFIHLCRSCHQKYDHLHGMRKAYHPTKEVKKKISKGLRSYALQHKN